MPTGYWGGRNLPLMDRFWMKVDKTGACWLWTAAKIKAGYGVINEKGTLIYAHRLSYELAKGKIPKGLHLDHLCRVTLCVNPDHLEAVTPRENLNRGVGFSGVNSRKTNCFRGHPLAGENLYVRPGGGRMCRECRRIKDLEKKTRNASR